MGWGVGEHDKRSYLHRKCRTLEYLLYARLFTLASFGELVETRERVLQCFCKVYFSKIHACLERNKCRLILTLLWITYFNSLKLLESYFCLPITLNYNTINYNTISEKAFLKRLVFKLRLKTLKSEVHLRSNGRSFHSFGAAATKARSPRVGRVLKFGFESRYLLFDLRL